MVTARRIWAEVFASVCGLSMTASSCVSEPESAPLSNEPIASTEEAVGGAVGDWTGFTSGQCVHGVYQFYLHRFGISLPGACAQGSNVGNCENCGACMIWQGPAVNPPAALFNRYDWGTTMPQTYDIVVYPPKSAAVGPGHVACVDHIDSTNPSDWQAMYVMDSNWYGNEAMATSVHTVTRAPYGIYRLKSLDNPAPTGFLDGADCTAIGGWSQDPSVPTQAINTDLYFDGPAGTPNAPAVRLVAGADRADLCGPLGSCNHGYSIATPRGAMNSVAHTVYAYGIDSAGGNNPLLTNSPKTFTCDPPAVPNDVAKRLIASGDDLTAWKYQTFFDMATYPQATVDGIPTGTPEPSTPSLIQATGADEIDVIDGTERRPLADMTAFAAWRFTPDMIKTVDPSELANYTVGANWPSAPLLIKSSDSDNVYVLDGVLPPTSSTSGPPTLPGTGGAGGDDSSSNNQNAGGGSSSAKDPSKGCSISNDGGNAAGNVWALLPLVGLLAFRRRASRAL